MSVPTTPDLPIWPSLAPLSAQMGGDHSQSGTRWWRQGEGKVGLTQTDTASQTICDPLSQKVVLSRWGRHELQALVGYLLLPLRSTATSAIQTLYKRFLFLFFNNNYYYY